MSTADKTNWWTWVQFAVLCVSIPTNVVLWIRNERIESAVNYAAATEDALRAVEEFRTAREAVDKTLEPEVAALLSESTELEVRYDKVLKLQENWLTQVSSLLEEAANRVHAYSGTTEKELLAVSRLREDSMNLVSPADRVGERLRGAIATVQRIVDRPPSKGGIGGIFSQGMQRTLSKKLDEAKALEARLADSSRQAAIVLQEVLGKHL